MKGSVKIGWLGFYPHPSLWRGMLYFRRENQVYLIVQFNIITVRLCTTFTFPIGLSSESY